MRASPRVYDPILIYGRLGQHRYKINFLGILLLFFRFADVSYSRVHHVDDMLPLLERLDVLLHIVKLRYGQVFKLTFRLFKPTVGLLVATFVAVVAWYCSLLVVGGIRLLRRFSFVA